MAHAEQQALDLESISTDKTSTRTGRPKGSSTKKKPGVSTPTTSKELAGHLWKAADKLRGSMSASNYRDFILGLIFLKYVGDTFEATRAQLKEELSDIYDGDDLLESLEDPDEYYAKAAFYVPREARWSAISQQVKSGAVGELLDRAMIAVMDHNENLRGALPVIYNSEGVDQRRLASVIDLISNTNFSAVRDSEHSSTKDVLGFVYEYFLGKFARKEGHKGGEFYTPTTVVNTLVGILQPLDGTLYDPCCGSGGMFVQSNVFVEHAGGNFKVDDQGRRTKLHVYGQELNQTTWQLARLNLAIHGIDGNVGTRWGDTFFEDRHPDETFDFVMTNPPFNIKDWARNTDDPRWRFGIPPAGNANYGWLQHVWSKLNSHGNAAVVMANGTLTVETSGQGEIRRAMVEHDAVAAVLVLPPNMFTTTTSPACVWILSKDKKIGRNGSKDRSGEILFLDARKMGHMVSRTERVFSEAEIAKIANTWCAWRGVKSLYHNDGTLVGEGESVLIQPYDDELGFSFSASREQVAEQDYVLTPGRYVGSAEVEAEDVQALNAQIADLQTQLLEQFAESERLAQVVREQLASLNLDGFGPEEVEK
ncbi:type I restriction-modification system subunit M [Rothia dentocariosa]|uniref:type I restriction-modification system subunit M n=1 Tax=Rothia dentocariosa TaxID=2047 RepID=UPI00244CD430|nr:class I SAM-dependent DNA methyltransferase [Rothia dentocariosa]